MTHHDFSHIADHERSDRRKAALVMAFLAAVVLLAVIGVIAVMAGR